MTGRVRVALHVALLAVLGAPVAFVGAFLLLPLWRAIERSLARRRAATAPRASPRGDTAPAARATRRHSWAC